MNKALFLFSIVAIFLTSCDSKEVKNTSETSRKTNEVAVIIDDQLWNGEIGDSVRNKFASPVVGLPQEEPIFTLNQYPVKPVSYTHLDVYKRQVLKFLLKLPLLKIF